MVFVGPGGIPPAGFGARRVDAKTSWQMSRYGICVTPLALRVTRACCSGMSHPPSTLTHLVNLTYHRSTPLTPRQLSKPFLSLYQLP